LISQINWNKNLQRTLCNINCKMNEYMFDYDLNDLYEKLISTETSLYQSPIECSSTKRFPELLEMLLEQNTHHGIISWLKDGRGFIIHNRKDFEKYMLALYFDGIKFRSFQRQLNIYGFVRLDKGTKRYTYGHKSFARNQDNNLIKRTPIKSKTSMPIRLDSN